MSGWPRRGRLRRRPRSTRCSGSWPTAGARPWRWRCRATPWRWAGWTASRSTSRPSPTSARTTSTSTPGWRSTSRPRPRCSPWPAPAPGWSASTTPGVAGWPPRRICRSRPAPPAEPMRTGRWPRWSCGRRAPPSLCSARRASPRSARCCCRGPSTSPTRWWRWQRSPPQGFRWPMRSAGWVRWTGCRGGWSASTSGSRTSPSSTTRTRQRRWRRSSPRCARSPPAG